MSAGKASVGRTERRESNAPEPPTLVDSLKALASDNRLAILGALGGGRTLDEIRLRPGPSRSGRRPDRPLARQSIREHLAVLLAAGLVQVRSSRNRTGRAAQEYVVDPAQLYSIVEDLRALSAAEPSGPAPTFATRAAGHDGTVDFEPGPKVVVVHGAREGKVFMLHNADLTSRRGWVIGRREDAHIGLDYDAYVSHDHAEIVRVGAEFRLIDLRTARNGTYLNWRRLPIGAEARIETGDVIGVGRSMILFRSE